MTTLHSRQLSPTGRMLQKTCIDFGGIPYMRLFRMLGLELLNHGYRWLNGQRELGSPYGRRLVQLYQLHNEETLNGTPLKETIAFDESIDWHRFWLEQEQEETMQRMSL